MIRRLGRQKKIITANTAKRYYATLMMHSFAPKRSIYAFLDLLYNVFCRELDYNYTEADMAICDIIADSFRELILNMRIGEDAVAIGSASYSVKIGLRCLALGDDTRGVFIDLINSALIHIHILSHKDKLLPNNYFEEIMCEWWESKSKDIGLPKPKKGIDSAVTKNTIAVKFVRLDDKVVISIPPIRMNYKEQSSLFVSIYLKDDADPKVSEELTVVGDFIPTSLQFDMELNKVLLDDENINFRIEISTPDEVLFSKRFDAEFILFGERNEILSKVNKPDNYFVYSRAIEKLQVPSDISTYSKNLYNIYPHDGEMLSGQQQSILFVNSQGDGKKENVKLFGDLHGCFWETEGEQYKVFSGHVNLLVSNFNSINGLELFVDGDGVLLSQLECAQDEYTRLYNIEGLLSDGKPYEIFLYSHIQQRELFRVKLVYFEELSIRFSQGVFYGDDIKSVTISNKNNVKELTWGNHETQIDIDIRSGKLIINIPYLKWRIDDKEWHNEPITELVWYKDLVHNGSLLEVSYPSEDADIQIYAVMATQVVSVNKNSSGKFEIGRSVYTNENNQLITFGIKVQQTFKSVHMFNIATQEHFYGEPLMLNADKVIFCPNNFIGESNRTFKITLTKIGHEPISLSSDKLHDGIIPNIGEGIYWVNITSQSGGLFAKKDQSFWQGEFVFGDKDRLLLSNMVYKISPLNGQSLSDSWKIMRTGYYVTNLIRMDGQPNIYTAKLFYSPVDDVRNEIENVDICIIEILSPIAMSILIKDSHGNYTKKLMCDRSGNLSENNFESRFPITITNYHFIEVKNV